jgi:hypothetical protein
MEQSILKSTKKLLGVGDDDTSFDLDILTHINGAISTLHDLGVGPQAGFVVEDDTVLWLDFLDAIEETVIRQKAQMYVYLKTRLMFDPPTTQYVMEALNKQIQELEWRINVNREESVYALLPEDELVVLDGGDPSGVG